MKEGHRVFRAPYRTPWGTGAVGVTGRSLVEVELPPSRAAFARLDTAEAAVAEAWVQALEAYFRGERLGWRVEEVPLDDLGLGEFERRVYRALLSVPPAVTLSYGTLAELAGYPRAARAVGNAMAANPIPIVVPCHRVVRADGSLGNYGSDPAWKPRLLEHEAAHAGRKG